MAKAAKFTEDTAKRIVAAVRKWERMFASGEFHRSVNQVVEEPDTGFMAQLTGAVVSGRFTRRWVYSFKQVVLNDFDDNTWQDVPDGITGNAINLLEGNTPDCGTHAGGVSNTSPDYPPGFKTLSISGAGEHETVVRMYTDVDILNTPYYWFMAIPTDFGPCEGDHPCQSP